MCIAIAKPKDKLISKETLARCFEANSDGAGFMYSEYNTLKIKKGFFTFKDFYEEYEPHQHKQSVLHFRIKTHGDINTENCHPYSVNNDLAFVHNGIISNVDTKEDKTKSDTWHFNEQYIKPMNASVPSFLVVPPIISLMEKYIGGSKLIFMNKKGGIKIINEDKGEWVDGVWYSNNSYKESVYQVVPYTHKPKEKKKHSIKFGDLVTLSTDVGVFLKGTIAKIVSFGEYGKIFVENTKTYDTFPVYPYQIICQEEQEVEVYEVETFLTMEEPHHKFKEGDIVSVVEDEGKQFLLVEGFSELSKGVWGDKISCYVPRSKVSYYDWEIH